MDDGLANKSVRAIMQDKQGYLWFGTEQGLSRFDGLNLTNYQADRNSSLSGNYITALTLDSQGNLWIGTSEHGLNKYLPAQDAFESLNSSNSQLSSNLINALTADNQSIWIGTNQGLESYDLKTQTFSIIKTYQADNKELPHAQITTLLITRENKLWVGTKKGLAFLDRQKQHLVRINLPEKIQPRVQSLAEDNQGNLWVGTSQGLYFYHDKNKKFIKQDKIITNQFILALLVDNSGNLWVGTLADGVYKIDAKNNYSHYVNDSADDKSLGGTGLLSIFQDLSGTIWMGTYEAGVHWVDPTVLSMVLMTIASVQ